MFTKCFDSILVRLKVMNALTQEATIAVAQVSIPYWFD